MNRWKKQHWNQFISAFESSTVFTRSILLLFFPASLLSLIRNVRDHKRHETQARLDVQVKTLNCSGFGYLLLIEAERRNPRVFSILFSRCTKPPTNQTIPKVQNWKHSGEHMKWENSIATCNWITFRSWRRFFLFIFFLFFTSFSSRRSIHDCVSIELLNQAIKMKLFQFQQNYHRIRFQLIKSISSLLRASSHCLSMNVREFDDASESEKTRMLKIS